MLSFFAIVRARTMRLACSSYEPWEKLRRITFMPAFARAVIRGACSVAGPIVATIFVFFIFKKVIVVIEIHRANTKEDAPHSLLQHGENLHKRLAYPQCLR